MGRRMVPENKEEGTSGKGTVPGVFEDGTRYIIVNMAMYIFLIAEPRGFCF